MAYVLILGATSDIGRHVAEEYARRGYHLYLAGRDVVRLAGLAEAVGQRQGIGAVPLEFDVRDVEGHEAFFRSLDPAPEGVVSMVGTLGRGPTPPESLEELREVLEVNYLGAVVILEAAASIFEERGGGFIVAVSSVAGDRGRGSNYPYGSAKAGLTAYLSGLRQRLHPRGVQVLTVKPGYVRTRMVEGMRLPTVLTAEPEEAARRIVEGQQRGKNTLYVRRRWRPIMAVLRLLPEWAFKRLRL